MQRVLFLSLAVFLCSLHIRTAQAQEPVLHSLEQDLAVRGLYPQTFRISSTHPLSQAQREALHQAGVEILEAAPPHGYQVRLPDGMTSIPGFQIEALPLAQKLSPHLVQILEGRAIPGGPITLRATCHRRRSVESMARAVRDLVPPQGTFLPLVDASGRGYLWLRVGEDKAAQAIARLAAHPDLLSLERQWPLEFKNDNSSWLIQSADENEGRTIWRNGLTGWGQIAAVADSGLDGDGCQFRYGPDDGDKTPAIQFPQPPAADITAPDNKVITYYVVGNADAYDDATGGYHGTHTVGDLAGDNYENLATATAAGHDAQDGMAPGAQIVFQDIGSEDGALRGLMGLPMYDLMRQAYDTGARVHNNSYGYSILSVGYDSDSSSIDQATWEMNDLLVVFAAGNSGADESGNLQIKSLGGTGSTAKNTLVIGASGPVELRMQGSTIRLENELLFFSSQGPTSDSRLKPDLVAPGMVFSASSDHGANHNLGCCDVYDRDMVASNFDDDNCSIDDSYPTFGTSFSSPISAGAAVLVRQYYTDGFWPAGEATVEEQFNPTNALVKATLIAGAQPLSGTIVGMMGSTPLTKPPSFEQGWGRVHLENALAFTGDSRKTLVLDDIPNPTPLNPMLGDAPLAPYAQRGQPIISGEERIWHLPVSSSAAVSKVVLVWSDPAAAPLSQLALVNNLDLEVTAPNGEFYLGNKEYDAAGFSKPSFMGKRDTNNNLEVVTLKEPAEGGYQVKLIAQDVPGNGQEGSDAQGYALVVVGEFLAPEPLALKPNHAAPGKTLETVELSGQNFVPGMSVDLGPGIEIGQVEVIDQENAILSQVALAQDAAKGSRDVNITVLRAVEGQGQGLFTVGQNSSGGCDCSAAGDAPAQSMGLLLILLWVFVRRR